LFLVFLFIKSITAYRPHCWLNSTANKKTTAIYFEIFTVNVNIRQNYIIFTNILDRSVGILGKKVEECLHKIYKLLSIFQSRTIFDVKIMSLNKTKM